MRNTSNTGAQLRDAVSWRLVRLMQLASRHGVLNTELNPLVQEFASCMRTLESSPDQASDAIQSLLDSVLQARDQGYSPGIRCCMATTADIDAWADHCIDTLRAACQQHGVPLTE